MLVYGLLLGFGYRFGMVVVCEMSLHWVDVCCVAGYSMWGLGAYLFFVV